MKDNVSHFIINELLSGKAVGLTDDLLLTGMLDSIAVMRLVAYIEEECGVSVPVEDITIEHFINIESIHNYLDKR